MDNKKYRFERKFRLTNISAQELEDLVKCHPAFFAEEHPPRAVNNIYFDSLHLDSFADNVEGFTHRRKIRIRWYGQLFGNIENPVLECKIKQGLVGKKQRFPFPAFSVEVPFNAQVLLDGLKQINLDSFGMQLKNEQEKQRLQLVLAAVNPTLLNHYQRKYFCSADKRYRLTIDTDLCYYPLQGYTNHFLHPISENYHIIMELKYSSDLDNQADHIVNFFPFRVTKSSKYVNGILRVYS